MRHSRQSLPPSPGEVFDLARHYELVRRTFYAAHAARLAAAGLDADDVFQRTCLSLMVRSAGPNPHDPSRGCGVAGWVRQVCRSVVSNALDQARRRALREETGGEQDAACSADAAGAAPALEVLLDARDEISDALTGARANTEAGQALDGGVPKSAQICTNPTRRDAVRDQYLGTMVSLTYNEPDVDALLAKLSPSHNGLTPQQSQLALLMVAGLTGDQAAQRMGVSRNTVVNWLRAPGVREFMARLGDALFTLNAQRLAEAQRAAIACLQRAVVEHGPNSLGVSAAQALLGAGLLAREG